MNFSGVTSICALVFAHCCACIVVSIQQLGKLRDIQELGKLVVCENMFVRTHTYMQTNMCAHNSSDLLRSSLLVCSKAYSHTQINQNECILHTRIYVYMYIYIYIYIYILRE